MWYGHVKRMADNRYPKRFIERTTEGKKTSEKGRNVVDGQH